MQRKYGTEFNNCSENIQKHYRDHVEKQFEMCDIME